MTNCPFENQSKCELLAFVCQRIKELGRVGDTADIESLRIDDTGIDSLELTELVMEIEDFFNVTIDDQNLSGEMTIKELCAAAILPRDLFDLP